MKLKIIAYLNKINSLIENGIKKGLIVPFDDEYYNELNKTIVNTIPVDLDIKYLMPIAGPGKCYDRSLKMFYAMDNSILVRGSLEYYRVFGEKEEINHGWVERDEYVYDPTWMYKFDKKYYYKIFKVKNTKKCNHEEYCNISIDNANYYDKIKNTTRDNMNEFDKTNLITTMPLLIGIAENNENECIIKKSNYDRDNNYVSTD